MVWLLLRSFSTQINCHQYTQRENIIPLSEHSFWPLSCFQKLRNIGCICWKKTTQIVIFWFRNSQSNLSRQFLVAFFVAASRVRLVFDYLSIEIMTVWPIYLRYALDVFTNNSNSKQMKMKMKMNELICKFL